MKLTIFMLAISLCIASPSLRRLQRKDLTDEHPPAWLFGDADSEPTLLIDSAEEALDNYSNEEEMIPFPNEEELLPSPSEEEEENNNGQTLPDESSNSSNSTTSPTDPTTNTTVPTNSSNNTGDSYTELTPAEVQNSDEVQGALTYGANETLKYGYAKNKIPVSNYAITKVISVGKQAISNGRNAYKCSVEIEDPRGVLVKAQYTIYVKASNQEMFVKSWAYQIFNLRFANKPLNTTTDTNTNNDTTNNSTDTEPVSNTTIPVDTVNTTIPENTTAPVTNTTSNNNNTANTTNDGYVPLQPSEIASSLEVQDVLSYGVDVILQKGFASGKIPQSEYDITQVVSVSTKIQNGKTYYSCSVELRDENQVSVKAQFTVSVKASTQEKSLSSWAYQVTTKFSIDETAYTQLNITEAQENPEAKSCLDFAIADVIANSEEFSLVAVNAVYTQTIKSTVYYKFDVELDNHKGKTIDLVATVAYKPAEDSRDVKAFSTKTTTAKGK